MKAFISYSLNVQEQYIVTLLSYQLREKGFSLIMSNNDNTVDFTTRNQIFLSQLFVGLISATGERWRKVLEEYNIATANNTPSILLVEDSVPVSPDFGGHFVRFNRDNPHIAIEEIKRRMMVSQSSSNEGLGWLLGGAALLAVVALLTSGNKH